MTPRSLLIDCDPGIDDALALILALTAPEHLELLGVTTVAGNKPLSVTTANVRRVLDCLPRPDLPVCAGAAHPLMSPAEPESDYHGGDGIGDIGLPPPSRDPDPRRAVDFLIETVLARPAGSVTLCAIGPLTNVALALAKEPRLAGHLDRLLVMGGALWDGPALVEGPEFNFRTDPQAAQIVLASGAAIELFGLNATLQAPLAGPLLDALADSPGALTAVVRRLLESLSSRERSLHDAYVIARLLDPTPFVQRPMAVAVEWRDPATGGTCRATPGGAAVTVTTGIDQAALLALLTGRLSGLG